MQNVFDQYVLIQRFPSKSLSLNAKLHTGQLLSGSPGQKRIPIGGETDNPLIA